MKKNIVILFLFFNTTIYAFINNQLSYSVFNKIGEKNEYNIKVFNYNILTLEKNEYFNTDFNLTNLLKIYYFSVPLKYYVMDKYNMYIYSENKKQLKKINFLFDDIIENPITNYKFFLGQFYPLIDQTEFYDKVMILDANDSLINIIKEYNINSGKENSENKSFFSNDGKYLYTVSVNKLNNNNSNVYLYKINSKNGIPIWKKNLYKLGNLNKRVVIKDVYNGKYLLLESRNYNTYEDTKVYTSYIYDLENDTILYYITHSIGYGPHLFYGTDSSTIIIQTANKLTNSWQLKKKCYIYDFKNNKAIGTVDLTENNLFMNEIKENKIILKYNVLFNSKIINTPDEAFKIIDKASHTTYYDTPIELKTYPWEMQ